MNSNTVLRALEYVLDLISVVLLGCVWLGFRVRDNPTQIAMFLSVSLSMLLFFRRISRVASEENAQPSGDSE